MSRSVYVYVSLSTSFAFKASMFSRSVTSGDLTCWGGECSKEVTGDQVAARSFGVPWTSVPMLLCKTVRECQPPASSNKPPVVKGRASDELKRATSGETYSGLSGSGSPPGMAAMFAASPDVAAMGAMVLTTMLCCEPSRARASAKPTMPSFYGTREYQTRPHRAIGIRERDASYRS